MMAIIRSKDHAAGQDATPLASHRCVGSVSPASKSKAPPQTPTLSQIIKPTLSLYNIRVILLPCSMNRRYYRYIKCSCV